MGIVNFGEEVFSTGDEKSFMTNVIAYLTNLDSRITCSSDVNTEYDESDLAHCPEFNFKIDNQIAFTLTRVNQLRNANSQFYFDCKGVRATLMYGNGYYNTVPARRHYAVSYIINDDFILLSINGYFSNGYPSNSNLNIIYTKQSDMPYYSVVADLTPFGVNTVFNISSRTFYADTLGGSAYGKFVSRFSYSSMPGYIDYVKSAVYVNNGLKQFAFNCIYDCTTVTVGDSVSLDDGRYYAVGPHQLVKVSDS